MVQMMSSFCTTSSSSPDKKPGDVVKLELEQEEKEDDQLGRLHKRLKLEPRLQNLLEEPSPLGLRLKKSPSFLDLIQMKLSQQKNKSKDQKGGSIGAGAANEKIKASNFPASLLKIGTWEYKSRYEGDLVAKCYFAKHKLVWEVLDGGLKNKIEIQWSDIVAIKANFPDDDGLETLDVVLARQPLFFRETNPQPRKHTLWQATSDFTGGQASINRRHFLQCQRGIMAKHFEKLTQCDPRLSFLSQQPEILLESPYFEQVVSGMSECDEASKGTNLNAEVHSSSKNNECQDFMETSPENACQETSAPSSAAPEIAEIKKATKRELGLPSYWEQMEVPGLQPSMSVSDLVKQIGHHFSEQMTAIPLLSSCDLKTSDILEGITQYLLSDSQQMSTLDQQPLLSKVNSLACLLQRSSQTVQYLPENGQSDLDFDHDKTKSVFTTEVENKPVEVFPATEGESSYLSGSKQELGMPRNDSVGELLLNLPRITSLPQFLHNM